MKTIQINHFRTGQILYQGRFANIRQAVEAALCDRVSLAFADLRHANLVNADLDGAVLDGAQLGDANLLGANLSEASLHRTCFQNALLHSATLCESIIDAANFEGALFGATDLSGAKIRRCLFSTLSALELNYKDAAALNMNGFMAAEDFLCGFSRTPLLLKGLSKPVACLDHKMLIGLEAIEPNAPHAPAPSLLAPFIKTHHALLQNLWLTHNGTSPALRVA